MLQYLYVTNFKCPWIFSYWEQAKFFTNFHFNDLLWTGKVSTYATWLVNSEWIREDFEESSHGFIWGTTPASAWREWEKPYNKPIRMTGLWVKIWT